MGAKESLANLRDTDSSARARSADPARWRLRLGASTEQSADSFNDLGVDPEAQDEDDPLDRREAPRPPGPWVRLAFADREWARMPGLYRRDLRDPGSSGHTWEVEVSSASPGEPVTLDLSETIPLPPGLVVRVLDREQGSVAEALEPRRTSAADSSAVAESAAGAHALASYRIVSYGPARSYRLAVLVGDEAYVARGIDAARVVPAHLTLERSAPNPFRMATRFRFGLPHEARVSASVFDVRGRRVARLVDGELLEAGQHAAVWDGRTSSGSLAPSGVYLLRLAADSDVVSSRMLLVR